MRTRNARSLLHFVRPSDGNCFCNAYIISINIDECKFLSAVCMCPQVISKLNAPLFKFNEYGLDVVNKPEQRKPVKAVIDIIGEFLVLGKKKRQVVPAYATVCIANGPFI